MAQKVKTGDFFNSRQEYDNAKRSAENEEDTQYWPWWIDNRYTERCNKFLEEHIWTNASNTPDMNYIRRKDAHLVAVYGNLKKGFSSHAWLGQSERLCTVLSKDSDFVMLEGIGQARYPTAFKGENILSYQKAHIFGELYLVPSSILSSLDKLEDNGYEYHRKETEYFAMGFPQLTMTAWTYIGNRARWNSKIDNYQLTRSRVFTKGKNPQCDYYFFTKDVLTS